MLTSDERLVWFDTETFGLDPDNDPILEVGVMITDLALNIDNEESWLIWTSPIYQPRFKELKEQADQGHSGSKYVLDMHLTSGLLAETMEFGRPAVIVEAEICEWLNANEIGKDDPMCGSSIQFDRGMFDAQMPSVTEILSYRNMDISTIKEACRRFNPSVYAKLDEYTHPKKRHRVLEDIEDSINEFKFYTENFLHLEY
jgi:oligoribonuclease